MVAPVPTPHADPGRVVLLNGTSSAGKSTLALELQSLLAQRGECWLVAGTDDTFAKLPQAWFTYGPVVGAHGDDGLTFEIIDGVLRRRVGPTGERILRAYRAWIAATARAGLNVIVDEVVLEADDWDGWTEALAGLPVRWVRVELALEVAEERERQRGDRPIGLARSEYDLVHRHVVPDVVVDTAECSPRLAARRVADALLWS